MEKLLVLFNERNQCTLSAVLNIARENSFEVHAIFLKHIKLYADFQYPFLNDLCRSHSRGDEDKRERQQNQCLYQQIEMVKKACEEGGVLFKAIIYENPSLDQLIAHSASASLLLLDNAINLKEYFITSINVSLQDAIVSLHCPVKMLTGLQPVIGDTATGKDAIQPVLRH